MEWKQTSILVKFTHVTIPKKFHVPVIKKNEMDVFRLWAMTDLDLPGINSEDGYPIMWVDNDSKEVNLRHNNKTFSFKKGEHITYMPFAFLAINYNLYFAISSR